jgi:hypothetical protein
MMGSVTEKVLHHTSIPLLLSDQKTLINEINDRMILKNLTLKKTIMPLLTVLLILIAAGVLLWLVNSYIPMDRKIKSILNVVVVIIVVWLLKIFGLFHYLSDIIVKIAI